MEKNQKIRVLVVDDDRVFHSYFRTMAFQANQLIELEERYDGASALEALKTHEFDIIFLDYYLGDLTGIDIAQEIRNLGLDPLIILISSSDDKKLGLTQSDFDLVSEIFLKSVLSVDILNIMFQWAKRREPSSTVKTIGQ